MKIDPVIYVCPNCGAEGTITGVRFSEIRNSFGEGGVYCCECWETAVNNHIFEFGFKSVPRAIGLEEK